MAGYREKFLQMLKDRQLQENAVSDKEMPNQPMDRTMSPEDLLKEDPTKEDKQMASNLDFQKKMQAMKKGASTPPGYERFKSLFNALGMAPDESVSNETMNAISKKMQSGIPLDDQEQELFNRYRNQ